MRRRKKINVADTKKVDVATSRLNDIATAQAETLKQIDILQGTLTELGTEASGLMKFLGSEELHVPGQGTHLFKGKKGNAKNVVDPKGFKEAAGENAFWSVVNVPIGEAKKHLGEKELAAITETTPGKMGEPVYSFKP